jgi:hypothetical protein
MLKTKIVIATTANNASTRKTFVKKLLFFRSFATPAAIAWGFGDDWMFEERTDDL